jgi:heme/copper-type cytochrome/quinol oxidase subunit 3
MADVTAAPPGMRTAPRTQLVATSMAIIAGSSMMAGLLGFYMSRRHAVAAPGHKWLPEDVHIPNAPLVMTVVTAVLAALLGHWAVWSGRRGERGHTYLAIAATILLILAFLNMVIFSMNRMDIAVGTGVWHNLAFTITGAVIALTIVSVLYIMLMGLRALGGDLGPEGTAPLAASVLFWDFVVLAWAAAWYAVYVVK